MNRHERRAAMAVQRKRTRGEELRLRSLSDRDLRAESPNELVTIEKMNRGWITTAQAMASVSAESTPAR